MVELMTSFRRNRAFRIVAALVIALMFILLIHGIPSLASHYYGYEVTEMANGTLVDPSNGEAIIDPDTINLALTQFQEQTLDELKREQEQFD